MIGVMLDGDTTYFFAANVPARPASADAPWSDWRQRRSAVPEVADADLALRTALPRRAAAAAAAGTGDGCPRRPPRPRPCRRPTRRPRPGSPSSPSRRHPRPARASSRRCAIGRTSCRCMAARILGEDADAARDAMYLVGEMRPPPAELGDAVRQRAAAIIAIAQTMTRPPRTAAPCCTPALHTVTTGVLASAFGLRVAGGICGRNCASWPRRLARSRRSPPTSPPAPARIIDYFEMLDARGPGARLTTRPAAARHISHIVRMRSAIIGV